MKGIIWGTAINFTSAGYKGSAYTSAGSATLIKGFKTTAETDPYANIDAAAGGKAEGSTVCAHTCVVKYVGGNSVSTAYAAGAWLMTESTGDRGTDANWGKKYFVPKTLTA